MQSHGNNHFCRQLKLSVANTCNKYMNNKNYIISNNLNVTNIKTIKKANDTANLINILNIEKIIPITKIAIIIIA
jgi:hypothetical protein